MPSTAPQLPSDRPRLEERLRADLLTQSRHHEWHTGDLEELRVLEARIQASAKQLEPHAPEAAILNARRQIAFDDLARRLARRAELPEDPLSAS